MRKRLFFVIWILVVIGSGNLKSQDLVDLVNPRIGSISHVLMPTFPTVHRPYGMLRFWPVYNPGILDTYLATRIYGFPINRPEHRGAPAMTLMPMMGKESLSKANHSSEFDRDFEITTPYYYSVQLDDLDMKVEF